MKIKKLIGALLALSLGFGLYAGFTPTLKAEAASAPAPPKLEIILHAQAVEFIWTVGEGGTELALTRNFIDYGRMGVSYYREIAFPSYKGETMCNPQYVYGRSYNSDTGLYSSAVTTELYDEAHSRIIYGRDVLYPCEDYLHEASITPEINIPTKYDQDQFIWQHHGDTSNIIRGTMVFRGQVADFRIGIPWIGYDHAEVTFNEYTFDIRTGPNRISFKSEYSGFKAYDIHFYFCLV